MLGAKHHHLYKWILQKLMIVHTSHLISNPEHILALDPQINFLCNSDTSTYYNADNDIFRRLFHGDTVKSKLLLHFYQVLKPQCIILSASDVPFIMEKKTSRHAKKVKKLVLSRIKIYWNFKKFYKYINIDAPRVDFFDIFRAIKKSIASQSHHKRGKSNPGNPAVNIIEKLSKTALQDHWSMILRSVAILQNLETLCCLLSKVENLWPTHARAPDLWLVREMLAKVLHEYTMGPLFEECDSVTVLRTALLPKGHRLK